MTRPDLPTAAQFDTGPLSWVMVEIREALGRSRTALFEAGGRAPEDQSTSLQHAKTHLHQAHGALQMVDVDGVVLMTQVAEDALERFKSGALKCSPDHAQTVANLYQAVIEYLEELLVGAPVQPVRLFPYYRALQEMLGAERVHPADLYFPDLSLQARMPAAQDAEAAAPDYPALRQRFERALLPYLKSTDAAAAQLNAAALRDAIAQVADVQREPQARTFWLALQAFAELVAAGQLEGGLYVKQLFGLINLQMRRLAQGNPALPAGMLREALFFIASVLSGPHAQDVPPLALHLAGVFSLDNTVPEDIEARRYGQIDDAVLERARQAMADAKAAWQRLSEGSAEPALEGAFRQALGVVAATSDKLGMAALATLMRRLAEVAGTVVAAGSSEALAPEMATALEMTTALLFAEHSLEHIRHLPDDFSAHADTLAGRLRALQAGGGVPVPAQPQGAVAQQMQRMQQDDTVVVLALEMKAGLRQVEKVLDEYYADASLRPSLAELDRVLHQLHGALAMLDQEDAAQAARHVRDDVRKLAAGVSDPSLEGRLLDGVAQNVSALGFFVDMLAQNAAAARERFAFDATQGSFRAVPFKKLAAAAPVPLLDEEVSPTTSPTPPPAPEPVAQASDAAIEAELLDIFITEAEEVLGFVHGTLDRARAAPGHADNLVMLRRFFHTLKGSGRMVGLNQFADAAAAIERTMNMWLAEERPATGALFGLLEYAHREMAAWVDALRRDGVSARTADDLAAAAARLRQEAAVEPLAAGAKDGDGDAFADIDVPAGMADAGSVADVVVQAVAEPAAEAQPEPVAERVTGAEAEIQTGAEAVTGLTAAADPEAQAELAAEAETVPEAEPAAEPAPEPETGLEPETRAQAGTTPEQEREPAPLAEPESTVGPEPDTEFEPETRAQAGTKAEPELEPAPPAEPEAAAEPAPETELEREMPAQGGTGPESESETESALEEEPESLAEPEAAAPETDAGPETEAGREPDAETETDAEFDALLSPPAESTDPAFELDHPHGNVIEFPGIAAPLLPPEEDNVKHVGALTIPLPLYNIYLAETDELVRLLARDFAEWRHEANRPVSAEALQAAHTLTGTSATVGFKSLRDLAYALEQTLESLQAPAPPLDHAQHDLLDFTVERIRQMLQSFALGEFAPEQPELISALHRLRDELARFQGAGREFDERLDSLFSAAGEPEPGASSVADIDAAIDDDTAADTAADADGDPDADAAIGAAATADVAATAAVEDDSPEARLDALFAAAYDSLLASPPPESDFASRVPEGRTPAAKPAGTAVQDDFDDLFGSPSVAPAAPAAARDDFDDLFDSAFDDAFAAPLSQIAAPAGTAPAATADSGAADEASLEAEAEVKAETEAEVDAEDDTDSGIDIEQDIASEPDAAPVPQPDAQPALEKEPVSETELEATLKAEAESEIAPEPAPVPGSQPESAPEPAPERESELEPEAGSESKAEMEAEPAPQPEPALDAADQSGPEPESVAEMDVDEAREHAPQALSAPVTADETRFEHSAGFEDELEAESRAEHEPGDVLATDVETEVGMVAGPVAAPESETVAIPGTEPEPETEPESVAALHSDAEPDVTVLSLPEAPAELSAGAPGSYRDELDADLLPVFLEEGADLLPQIGQSLRTWQRNPSDFSHAHKLQRVLHTVKGSARMAGAMRLGQHAHEIETHIENMVHANSATPHAFDELLAHYDHALLLFEQLQHPAALDANGSGQPHADGDASGTAASEPDAAHADGAAGKAAPAAAADASAGDSASSDGAAARSPLVRVRADILDRLVNQAGEVSISRSRLENEVGALRSSLGDFSDNLGRLRRQLREIEMQAESQIASRMAISSEREFDPLEFDRFTRLQELTRMMAESVNDVASFHETLSRSVDSASGDLAQQARMTRDLQRDLMRVRMVPFASISERLFRVARQSAKEMDKRVNLDIRGGGVEIDRSVLERMAAPFEHLLRNAIVHGVESRARRAAAGKDETGELLVQVSQQGNEVVLEFSDDGAGLDLDRIRAKARSLGLLREEEELSDTETAGMIFEPGFSTADTLTELAGRGVGMDIVRSEAQALGGRVEIASERGKGARFTIHLPLTLAVTQVVLLSAGGRNYAVPSTLVEQVVQMKEGALREARGQGHVALLGQQAPLHYLPAMLGLHPAQPAVQRSAPVLMLRSGQERVALQVDEVAGNREVVIKNIGQQLARMPGISGATVLGSGEIVLILNPVALAQHLASRPDLADGQGGDDGRDGGAAPPLPAALAAVGSVIMVVDDSLTVRRVSQRLLEREGYRVVLAKDGVDALEQIQESAPDLMLVDIEMPRMDGFDLTRNVRGGERTRDIPIIMITSRSADKHRNYAAQLGVNAYFGKPFQEAVLLAAIEGLLADARSRAIP